MDKLTDKLGFVQTFLFLHRFLFLLFYSSVLPFYVGATALNKSAILQITECCYLTRLWLVRERVCQLKLYPVKAALYLVLEAFVNGIILIVRKMIISEV